MKGISSPFWAEVRTLLHGQIAGRRNALFSLAIDSVDRAFEAARMQGEIGALQLAMNLPDIILQDVERDILTLNSLEEDGNVASPAG